MNTPALFKKWECQGLPGLPFPSEDAEKGEGRGETETPPPSTPSADLRAATESKAALRWRDLAPGKAKLAKVFEAHLRTEGWPYVAVDESKKAILGNSAIKSFDFLVYSSAGPNLLVLLVPRRPTRDQVEQMQEWEKVFGKEFFAAFTFQAGGTWQVLTLADLREPCALQRARDLKEFI